MSELSVAAETGVESNLLPRRNRRFSAVLEVQRPGGYPWSVMRFTKMHGIGNDYVYVNGFEQPVDDPAQVARKVSDRHFGIGSDGLILILPSDKADVRMRMFNVDGSEGEMC